MNVKPQELTIDPARLYGLSERLLRSHHQNNYGGAVKRLNAIRDELARLDWATVPAFQVNGLKREELLATNSMLLHELYFSCLGGEGAVMAPAMALALAANFGSVERWHELFVAMGKAQGGGSGWVLLSFQPREGTLVNQWAADHSHAIAGGTPILALDMYEHAYHMDFGAKAADYVDAFMANINWEAVYLAYQQAVHGASDAYAAVQDDTADAVLIDVRRAGVPACRRVRAGQHHDCRRSVARPGQGGRLGGLAAAGQEHRRLLRLWTRGRARDRHAIACAGPECPLSGGRHRRLGESRPPPCYEGISIMKWVTGERQNRIECSGRPSQIVWVV